MRAGTNGRAVWLAAALLALGCHGVDVVIAPVETSAGGAPGAGGAKASDGEGGSGGRAPSEGGAGEVPGGAGGGAPGMGGAAGAGGGYGMGGAGPFDGGSQPILDAGYGYGGAYGSGGGQGRNSDAGPLPPPACPAPAMEPAPFFEGPYIDIGNVLVDAHWLYLKVSDCCGADPPGYTLRVSLPDGPVEMPPLHTSVRYHPGLAQDDANLYLSSEEGLKVFSKNMGTFTVHAGLVYDALTVAGGLVYGVAGDGSRLERVGPTGDVRLLVAMGYQFSNIVADTNGVYATNANENGQLIYVPQKGALRVLALGPGSGGELAADADFLYWSSGLDLQATRKADGSTQLLAMAPSPVGGITTDADYVYFTARGDLCSKSPAGVGRAHGGVYRVRKGGGMLETLASEQVAPGKIAVDIDYIYWAVGSNRNNNHMVRRVGK